MVFRVLGLRFAGPSLPMLLEQRRPQFIEQSFDLAPVLHSALQQRHQIVGNIHAASFATLGEGKNKGWVLIAAGASSAAWSEAGFANLSDRAFNGRPEMAELLKKELFGIGIRRNRAAHEYGICYNIPYCKKKMMPEKSVIPFKTEGLHIYLATVGFSQG